MRNEESLPNFRMIAQKHCLNGPCGPGLERAPHKKNLPGKPTWEATFVCFTSHNSQSKYPLMVGWTQHLGSPPSLVLSPSEMRSPMPNLCGSSGRPPDTHTYIHTHFHLYIGDSIKKIWQHFVAFYNLYSQWNYCIDHGKAFLIVKSTTICKGVQSRSGAYIVK
jgi:hypothetical protein